MGFGSSLRNSAVRTAYHRAAFA